MADPWERRPGETAPAWNAFTIYRDLGPDRTLVKVGEIRARTLGRRSADPRQVETWSSQNDWVVRAAAYDDHLDQLKRKASEDALIAMVERQVAQAEAIQQAAFLPFRELLNRIATGAADLSKADVRELLQIARLSQYAWSGGVRQERIARGLPAEGPIRVEVEDESSRDVAEAIDRLAGALGVEPGEVVDLVAERRARARKLA